LATIKLATKTEQRVTIKLFVKLKKIMTENFSFLRVTYEKDAISRARLFEWYQRFTEGRGYVEDYERPGRPVTIETDENVGKVRTLVRTVHLYISHQNYSRGVESGRRDAETNLNAEKCARKWFQRI
jgi:hypothetical protein